MKMHEVVQWLRTQHPTNSDGSPDPTAKYLLVTLASYADSEGGCFPSIDTLMTNTGLGERSVQSALKRLRSAGYIAVESKRGFPNFYTIDYSRPAEDGTRRVKARNPIGRNHLGLYDVNAVAS